MPLRHSLLAVLVMAIWGTNFLAIDAGVADVPPALFVAIRFVVVLLPAIFLVPRPAAPLKDVLVVGLFLSLGQFGLMYTAIWLGMPPGLASLVLQAQVVFTVLFASVTLRERPTTPQLVGVAIGAVGLLVVGVGRSAATPGLAFLLTIAAAASWATGNVIVRRLGSPDQAAGAPQGPLAGLSMTVWSALVVPVPMFGLALALDGPSDVGYALTHLSTPAILSTLYTAWLASLVGYGIWNTLLARHRAGAVAPFTMLVPVFGMTGAWLALGEVPNVAEAVGGALLLLGVAITSGLVRRPTRRYRT